MKLLSENALDAALNVPLPVESPAGLEERLLRAAFAAPQKKAGAERLRQLCVDIIHDIFGHMGDSLFYNAKWRLAGAACAMLIGITAGYYAGWSLPVDEELAGAYAIDQSEEMLEVI